MTKIEIDKNKPLSPGDIIEMHFVTLSMVWLTAAQIAMIEWQLEKRKDFRIRNHLLPANNRVIFTIEILKTNPVIVTAAIIAGIIVGAAALVGGIAWLTFDKVLQIMQEPAGKVAVAGMGALSIAAAIAIVLFLLPRGK